MALLISLADSDADAQDASEPMNVTEPGAIAKLSENAAVRRTYSWRYGSSYRERSCETLETGSPESRQCKADLEAERGRIQADKLACQKRNQEALDAQRQAQLRLAALGEIGVEPVLRYIEHFPGIRACFYYSIHRMNLAPDPAFAAWPGVCAEAQTINLNPLIDFLEVEYRKKPFARRLALTVQAVNCECCGADDTRYNNDLVVALPACRPGTTSVSRFGGAEHDCTPAMLIQARLRHLIDPKDNLTTLVKEINRRCQGPHPYYEPLEIQCRE